MNLSTLRSELETLDRALEIFSDAQYSGLLDEMHEKRWAITALASHLRPRNAADAVFLSNVIQELLEFVADEPAYEYERMEALNSIGRMTNHLRSFHLGE